MTLLVPELPTRPVVVGSCCAVPVAQAIERALGEWAGVEAVAVDEERGRVQVTVGSHSDLAPDDLVWSLRMLDLMLPSRQRDQDEARLKF